MSGNNFELGSQRLPGLTPEITEESVVFLRDNNHLTRIGIIIAAGSLDAGHTGKTYKLRAGMALVRVITGANKNKYVPADHADAPANSDVESAVILMETTDMRQRANPSLYEDQMASGLVHGFVDDANINYVNPGSYKVAIQDVLPLVSFHTVL